MEEPKKIIPSEPAAYNASSEPERESWITLWQLLGATYFRGEIHTDSTVPNTDGILEILNDDRVRVARVDVQMKTLEMKNYSSPKYQCSQSFLSYCEKSLLPVLLIAVNNKDKIAYWRHIDEPTLHEALAKLKGETVSIDLPKSNIISVEQIAYRQHWIDVHQLSWRKVWNFDQLVKRQKQLEAENEQIKEKTENPIRLPLDVLKGIHRYLDEYNYILDIEFPTVKSIKYPNYWKIGLGVISYQFIQITYILYPVPYQKNQVMIKDVELESGTDWHQEMFKGRALVLAIANSISELLSFPRQRAYSALRNDILKVVEENNFTVEHEMLAREYLISFIDKYAVYLDLEPLAVSYSLKELMYRLVVLLPMHEGMHPGFADHVKEITSSIDSHDRDRPSSYHKEQLELARKRIAESVVPKVKVTLTSEKYNIDLIYYYIHLLNDKGMQQVQRLYAAPMRDESKAGEPWKTWYVDTVWRNFQIFVTNLDACFESYLKTHFFKLQHALNFEYKKNMTRVYVLYEYNGIGEPHVEMHILTPQFYEEEGRVLFFKEADSPITGIQVYKGKFDYLIDGKQYRIKATHGQPLDFMFTLSPTYSFMKEHILEKLRPYFSQQERK